MYCFKFRRLKNGGDDWRQSVRNQALGLLRVGGSANGLKRHQVAAFVGQARHQIQDTVNNTPGQVASERANEHRSNILATRLCDAERTGESEDHDQSKEDFGNALVRVEDPSRGFAWIVQQEVYDGVR